MEAPDYETTSDSKRTLYAQSGFLEGAADIYDASLVSTLLHDIIRVSYGNYDPVPTGRLKPRHTAGCSQQTLLRVCRAMQRTLREVSKQNMGSFCS